MLAVLSSEQVRNTDKYAIEELGMPGALLMENAAHYAKTCIDEIFKNHNLLHPKISIFCGCGNNGGDGLALARHLSNNYDVTVFLTGNIDKMSPETLTNYKILLQLRPDSIIKINSINDLSCPSFCSDVIIDALIGIGGSNEITGIPKEILKVLKTTPGIKIAIDAPSGLNTDIGKADPDAFEVDYTITMFALKKGLLINSGYDLSGEIYTANLGLPKEIQFKFADNFTLERTDIYQHLPIRKRVSNKSDYGKLAIIAGSSKYPGAAALSANAAIKSGAGLVYLLSTKFHNAISPEVIQLPLEANENGSISKKNYQEILDFVSKCDAVVIGPGLSDDFETIDLATELIISIPDNIPVLVDADGLRAINNIDKLRKNILLTPHLGEFARLTDIDKTELRDDHFKYAKSYAQEMNCSVLVKYTPTVITNGEISYWNLGGNPGMASGGTGDVLSGIIGTLLAQKIEPAMAAAMGAFIHSLAGDMYAKKYNFETLSASSLINMLRFVF